MSGLQTRNLTARAEVSHLSSLCGRVSSAGGDSPSLGGLWVSGWNTLRDTAQGSPQLWTTVSGLCFHCSFPVLYFLPPPDLK